MTENQSDKYPGTSLSVLISGGSGLIGRNLTSALLSDGYKVSHLSRSANYSDRARVFNWEPEKGIIDNSALDGVDYIIHLSGANLGEKPWSKIRKGEIVTSRINSANLLFNAVKKTGGKLKAFISASAIGYYGSSTSEIIYTETDSPDTDFLGSTCRLWEEAADKFSGMADRVVKIRTGIVLEKSDGALAKLLIPSRIGIFPRLGNGRQYMPWIHISDLVGIYLKSIKDENIAGSYNAVAPQYINQSDFMRSLAKILKKPFFHPPVPSIILRAVLGEMSDMVVNGSRVSSEKIEKTKYNFMFRNIEDALENVLEG